MPREYARGRAGYRNYYQSLNAKIEPDREQSVVRNAETLERKKNSALDLNWERDECIIQE